MGTKYSTVSISGYNATPPSDDGTVSESNKVKWSTIKTKLTDPNNTAVASINSKLVTHFDRGPVAVVANTTLAATHYAQMVQVSGSGVTLTLTDAATLTAGWFCEIVSTDASNNVALSRATASDTINETSADVTILPLQALRVMVNAAANGFLVKNGFRHGKATQISDPIVFVSTDAGAGAGPAFVLDRNSPSPAVSDLIGIFDFAGRDSGGNAHNYARQYAVILDPTDTSEDGRLSWQTSLAGTVADRLHIGAGLYTAGGSDQGANTIQGFSGVFDGANRVYSAVNTVPEAGLGSSVVSQAKLKTTTAAGSTTLTEIGAEEAAAGSYTLTGGTYSWWQASANATGGGGDIGLATFGNESDAAAGVLGLGGIEVNGGLIAINPSFTFFVNERYIQASPPYKDGPCFVFIAVDALGNIMHTSVAPDPPWAYHGPTDITPQRTDKIGKHYRTVVLVDGVPLRKAMLDPVKKERYLSGSATVTAQEVEITPAYKDSDKAIMPHPFLYSNLTGLTVFLLEPGTALMSRFETFCHEDMAREVRKIILDNNLSLALQSPLAYMGAPPTVSVCRASMKLTAMA